MFVCVYLLESCVQASLNLNLRFKLLSSDCIIKTVLQKQVDNLMKNLEDSMKTKPKLCAARGFSKFFRAYFSFRYLRVNIVLI